MSNVKDSENWETKRTATGKEELTVLEQLEKERAYVGMHTIPHLLLVDTIEEIKRLQTTNSVLRSEVEARLIEEQEEQPEMDRLCVHDEPYEACDICSPAPTCGIT